MLVGPAVEGKQRLILPQLILNPANVWYNAKKSIRVGMTEFGEFATPAKAGLAYGADNAEWTATESWASEYILSKYWIQGWTFLNELHASGQKSVQFTHGQFTVT